MQVRDRPVSSGATTTLATADLVQVAAGLFACRGYKATTMREIAAAAGVSRGDIYHQIECKDSIMEAILSPFVGRTVGACECVLEAGLGPRGTVEELIRASLEVVASSREATLIYQAEARTLAAQPRFAYLATAGGRLERVWSEAIERGVAAGEFRSDCDPALIGKLALETIWMTARWCRPGSPRLERVIGETQALLLGGVRGR
jgi:AcrR family transcriptional regulator